jgi:hypothetical protein
VPAFGFINKLAALPRSSPQPASVDASLPARLTPRDVYQENDNCSLAAATLAVMAARPDRLKQALKPAGPSRQRLGAPWWRSLQSAMATHVAQQGRPDDVLPHHYMKALTGLPCYLHPSDIRNKAYLFTIVAQSPTLPGTLSAEDIAVLSAWAQANRPTLDALCATFDQSAPFSSADLDAWMAHAGVAADICAIARRALANVTSGRNVPWITSFLGETVATKLEAQGLVCLSTKRVLRPNSVKKELASLFTDPRYAAAVCQRSAAGGIMANHAYAVTGARREPVYRVQLVQGVGNLAPSNARPQPVASAGESAAGQAFWVDLSDVLQHTAGFYFSRDA